MIILFLFFLIWQPISTSAFSLEQVNVISFMLDYDNITLKKINENVSYYRLGADAGFDKADILYFPGIFYDHSFESTFRLYGHANNNFSLFRLKGRHIEIRLDLLPSENLLTLHYKTDLIKREAKIKAEVFDGSWHSIMYYIKDILVSVCIDCKLCSSSNKKIPYKYSTPYLYNDDEDEDEDENEYSEYREKRSLHNFGKSRDKRFTQQHLTVGYNAELAQTVPIDISKMTFHPFGEMPSGAICEDIPILNDYSSSSATQFWFSFKMLWFIAASVIVLASASE